MLEMTQSPAHHGTGRRVLGNEPVALAFAMLGMLVTAGVLFLQMRLREGQFEPEAVPIFYRLFLFEDYPASFLFIVTLLIAAIPEVQRAAIQLAKAAGERPAQLSAVALVVFAAGAWWIYHAHPLSMDEAAPYLQSQAFAEGALVGKYPPALLDWLVVPGFQNYFIHVSGQTGEVASSYWPGFALLLTPFTAANVPWLCNPVLGALSVWVIHRLTLRLTDSTQLAGTAALFAIASAAFVINSMSFYAMTAHLLCNATFALLLLAPTPGRCVLAGLVGGLALTLHNPVPHMLFAPVWLIWLAAQKNRWVLLASIAGGYLPWIIIVGFGWQQLLQSLAVASNGATDTSAGAQGVLARAFERFGTVFKWPTAPEFRDRAIALGKLWLWSAPLMILMAGIGFWRHRSNVHVRLLLGSALLTLAAYFFVPLSQGHGWGYRYFHSAWFVLPIFAAAALAPARGARPADAREEPSPVAKWTLGAAMGGLLIMTPYFAWQVHSFIGNHLAQLPTADHGRPRVVIINFAHGYYTQDLVMNDPFLRKPVLRMITHGRRKDAQMMAERFPDLTLLAQDQRGSVWGYADSAR